jgi:UDP-N-acetylglucosamine:LPS N-acetylglucosamine transferase
MPGSASDHQTENARVMVKEGRAVLLPQTDTLASRLVQELGSFMADPELRMSLSKPLANSAVQDCLEDLTERMV